MQKRGLQQPIDDEIVPPRSHRHGTWPAVGRFRGPHPALPNGLRMRPESKFVNEIADAIAIRAPISAALPRCAAAFALLAGAESVRIALRGAAGDELVFPVRGPVPPDSLLASVLASGETIALQNLPTALGIPIRSSEVLYGAIELEGIAALGPASIALLESCAALIGGRFDRDATVADLHAITERALTDPLTGVANRRAFDDALGREWAVGMRERTPVALLLIAVGGDPPDAMLVEISRALRWCAMRPRDIVARLDDGTFAMLLPRTGSAGTNEIAVRVREAVAQLAVVKICVAVRITEPGETPAHVVAEAEAAL